MKFFRNAAHWIGGVAVALGLGVGLVGCGSAPEPAPAAPPPAAGMTGVPNASRQTPDRLFPGERISLVFSGIPTPPSPHEEQIRTDGTITPPLIGRPVKAAGRTVAELQEDLQNLYVPGFFRTLTVTVKNEERYFFVGGEVKFPGQKPYLSEMTVLKAIQSAGDFTDFANRNRVQVTRSDGRKLEVNCRKALQDPQQDVPIFPGDILHVPRRWP